MSATFRFPTARETIPVPMVTAEATERQAHLRRDNASLEDARSVAWRLYTLHFIETFDDTISLQPGEPIDPKDPVELIDLVLETYREQTSGLFDLFHTAQIVVAHPHTGMAFDLFRYTRHGDAAFFVPDHVGGSPDNPRVHIGPHFICCCEFDHGQPLQNTDMSGGDSDCRSRTQCIQEVSRKRAKILVKYDDALGRRAKVMIGKSQDRLHRHGIFSTSGPDRPSLAKALSTLVEYRRFRNRFGSVGTGISR
jgi:hypothetical protein